MKKKMLALLLSVVMTLGLAACVQPAPNVTPSQPVLGEFTPGAYTGVGQGRNGKIKIEVVFSADAIDSIAVTAHEETAGIADPALERLPQAIMKNQSLAVDAIAGCTITCDGVVEAVADCINQAGGDAAAWKARTVATQKGSDEELTTDVVIAGAGVAGLSAGIEALEAGAKVILLEKMAAAGGSTAQSGGKILAANNYLQKAQGIEDSPELFAQYLMSISENKADPDFINLVANQSAATVEWMVAQGVQFTDELETPMADMQPKRGLFCPESAAVSLVAPLQKQFEDKGGILLLETPATDLITDAGGAVVGIIATKADGSTVTVTAQSVILATGGFTGSPELMAKYAPSYPSPVGNAGPGNTGDGLLMAERVGADIFANDCLIAQLTDKGLTGRWDACGLFVSPEGERFMNENLPRPRKARAFADAISPALPFFLHDESEVNDRMPDAIEAGTAFEASSVAELAEKIGADAATLQATLERYNELCAKGVDEDFSKDAGAMKAISLDGQLYAIKLSINCAGTTGGPRINLSAQVLDKAGKPITGLYAAGEVASGAFFANEYPGSGTAIQCYTTFGRIAGQSGAAAALGK